MKAAVSVRTRNKPAKSAFAGNKMNRLWQEAQRLSVSDRQLRDWIRDRVVPFTKVGATILFDPAKVDAALAAYERSAVQPAGK